MISTLISYLTFNKRSGIFSKEIRATQHKINQFNDLLKNDEFKVGLILAIEKKIQEIYHIAPNETHEDKNFECRLLYAQFDSFKKTFLRGEADINKVKYMLRSLSEDEEKLDKDVKAKFLEKEIDSAKKKQSSNEKSSFQEFRTPKLPPNFTKIL